MVLLLLSLLIAEAPTPETVDRIVSVVDGRVITASDLAFEIEFSERDRSPVPVFEQGDPLQRLEDYRRLRAAAGDVPLFRPTEEAVGARVRALESAFDRRSEYEAFLRRWGLDEGELRDQVGSRMVVELYVLRNLPDPQPEAYEAWIAARRAAEPARRL